MKRETPSAAMFDDLRRFGGITNRDAAWLLLNPKPTNEGKSLRDRVDSRTFLSREIVHSEPGSIHPEQFRAFDVSTQNIIARMAANRSGSADARSDIARHYRADAAQAMAHALRSWDLDDRLYLNAIAFIDATDLSEGDRAVLYLMLFIIIGCLGDPQRAVTYTEQFANEKMGYGIRTPDTVVGERAGAPADQPAEPVRLGLIRLIDQATKPPVYPLDPQGEGTIIGSLAAGNEVISDVDLDVSRRHLRIWSDGCGRWFAQGLDSTNGTVLISGADRTERVVERPRAQREESPCDPPVELHPGDTLRLGGTTRFLAVRVTA